MVRMKIRRNQNFFLETTLDIRSGVILEYLELFNMSSHNPNVPISLLVNTCCNGLTLIGWIKIEPDNS